MTKERALGLDTLRGCAVLAVLFYHYLANSSVLRTPALLPVQAASEHLFFGVDMFFVLSGFLIGQSLMRSKGQPGYFANYFTHRAFRILPLYYLWLGIFLMLVALHAEKWGGSFPGLLDAGGVPLTAYVVFLQNFASAAHGSWGPAWLGITWTLAIEMHFYILAAIFIYIVPIRYVGLVCAGIIAVAVELKQGTYTGFPAMVLTQTRLEGPFVGVLCAWLWRFPVVPAFVSDNGRTLRWLASVLVVGHYASINYSLVHYPISSLSMNAFVFGLATLAFAGPAAAVTNPVVAALRWCGKRCYAIYLFHTAILGLFCGAIFGYPPNVFAPGVAWPAVIPAAIVTIVLAGLSWRWLEEPLIVHASARRRNLVLQRDNAARVGL